MKKLEVGDVLYYEYSGRGVKDLGEIREKVITKIGNKYFYCNNDLKTPYAIDSLRYHSDVSVYGIQLYHSKKEIEDNIELAEISKKISRYFDRFSGAKLNVDQLRQIKAIIEPTETKN